MILWKVCVARRTHTEGGAPMCSLASFPATGQGRAVGADKQFQSTRLFGDAGAVGAPGVWAGDCDVRGGPRAHHLGGAREPYALAFALTFRGQEPDTFLMAPVQPDKKWTQKAQLVDSRGTICDFELCPKHAGLKVATVSVDGVVRLYEAMDVMDVGRWTLMVRHGAHDSEARVLTMPMCALFRRILRWWPTARKATATIVFRGARRVFTRP